MTRTFPLLVLFCLGFTSISARATPDVVSPGHTPASWAQRFGLRSYVSAGQSVLVDAHHDRIALRVTAAADGDDVAVMVEEALAKVTASLPVAPRVTGRAQAVRPHGLFTVVLDSALRRETLIELSAAISAHPAVLAVYPVLRRGTGRAFSDDHLVVTAARGKLDGVLAKVLARTGGAVVRKSRVPDTALVRVGAEVGFDAITASSLLVGVPDIVSAEPDLYREAVPAAITDDPLLPSQWHLFRSDDDDVPGAGEIFADEAWDTTMGSPSVVVAVFDSGTDMTHPDLVPNIVGGFDAVSNDDDPTAECSRSPDGRDYADSCPQSAPFRESHGTSVSGTIAARGNNGIGVAGVCPMCSLMPVRLLGGYSISSLTTAEAFIRAVDEGAWVINNSWGPGASIYFPLAYAEQQAFEYARTRGRDGKGTVILFAAGNDTVNVALDAYAATPLTLAISASTNLDDFAIYSNYGREIDLAAPSQGGMVQEDSYGIVTTDHLGDDGYDPGDYAPGFGGTSAASPVAAGVAALILSVNPELTAEQVRMAMTSTADKIEANKIPWAELIGQDLATYFAYDETRHSLGFGYGRVNAAAAVASALTPTLVGASCDTPGCPVCGVTDRCQTRCDTQADCPDGSVCTQGSCTLPRPRPTEIGQPCSADCPYCVDSVDTDFAGVSLCTDTCESDASCPVGFDCRLTEAGGERICAPGSVSAGEPQGPSNCYSSLVGAELVVEGDDGQPYCSDLCFSDDAGACPYGFYCEYVNCDCTRETNWGCREYTCTESRMNQSNFGAACLPLPGFGTVCAVDADCAEGDYCGPDGRCRVDDREGCPICQSCTSDAECGSLGICGGLQTSEVGYCTRGCSADSDCPGDSRCAEIESGRRSYSLCVASDAPEGAVCGANSVCEVECRADVPCEPGERCDEGACVPDVGPSPSADGGPTADGGAATDAPSGCGCQETSPASLFPLLAWVGLLSWGRRRVRK